MKGSAATTSAITFLYTTGDAYVLLHAITKHGLTDAALRADMHASAKDTLQAETQMCDVTTAVNLICVTNVSQLIITMTLLAKHVM